LTGAARRRTLPSFEPTGDDAGVYTGEIAGVPGSYVVLAYVEEAVAGTLYVPGQGLYRVRTRAGGELHLTEIDPARIPQEELPIIPELPADLAGTGLTTGATTSTDATTTVDLMVVYTPATANANGGATGTLALINAAVATANLGYRNSGIALTLRLVKAQQTSYVESHALGTDLGRLASKTDGFMDEIHAARTSVKADLVSLLVTG